MFRFGVACGYFTPNYTPVTRAIYNGVNSVLKFAKKAGLAAYSGQIKEIVGHL